MEWLFPLVVGGLLVVFIIGRGQSWRRMRAMKAWALAHGLDFAAGADRRVGITFLEVPLIGSGSAGARHRARGRWQGREIHAFDLVVGPGADGGHQGTSCHTCVLVKADLPLIPLSVLPRDPGVRFPEDLGFEPVTLDAPAFDEAFEVHAADSRWARDLLHARTRADLLAAPRWRLELGGWFCLVAAPGHLDPERLDEALAVAAGFLDGIPDAVRREILGTPPAASPSVD